MTPYPVTLPLDCVTTVIDILKNKKVQERKKEFGLCAWNIQGFVQKMVLGDPSAVVGCDGDCDCTTELEQLYEVCAEYNDVAFNAMTASEPSDNPEAIDPMTIVAIISAIMQVIEMLRNRKK